MYESLLRIHTNYYRNKVSPARGFSPPEGCSAPALPCPSPAGTWDSHRSAQVDAGAAWCLWAPREAAELLGYVAAASSTGDSSCCGQCTAGNIFCSLSSDCPVKYPRLKDTNFTGVTVEDCRMILATGSDPGLEPQSRPGEKVLCRLCGAHCSPSAQQL